jgi:hypothetical protein
MINAKQKLTLDQPVTYQIKTPEILEYRWSDWVTEIEIRVESDQDYPLTILTVTVDQAALKSILRRLYSLGIPLISVVCLDFN